MKTFLYFILVLMASYQSLCAEEQVDDILDRLEQKLLESKQESLLLNDNWNKPIRASESKEIVLKEQKIKGNLPAQKELQQIGSAIDKVENEVERLSSDVEKLKRIIGSYTKTNSQINIYVEVTDPSKTSLREIDIKLDRFPIYKLNPDVGIWLPRQKIPIFSGPLDPGKHSIALTGRMARVVDENMPVDDNIFHIFDQEFTIEIPQGRIRKDISIKLERIKDKNFKAKAILVESTL